MEPITPFWFKQRQCKAEPVAGANLLRLSGPNLGDCHIGIQQADNNRWRAVLQDAADGPETAATEAVFDTPQDAWEAAFELYRANVIV